MQKQYFANEELYSEAALQAFLDKITTFRDFCDSKGLSALWNRALKNFFGVSSDGTKESSEITRGGDSGQYTMAKINNYRNLIEHQHTLITQSRPAGVAKAINSDPISLKQSLIGTSLMEYYMSQVGWEEKYARCAELMLVVAECFDILDWDTSLGDPVAVDPETQEQVMSGDAILRTIGPWNVARECYADSFDSLKWFIYTYDTNKYDLAKKYPNQAELIINSQKDNSRPFQQSPTPSTKESDMIRVNVLSHEPTPSVPQGRYAMFIEDAILLDGPFPYVEMNVYPMRSASMVDSPFAYTSNFGLLAIEEVKDALNSSIISNQVTFGAQTILSVKGANIDHTELSKGFSFLEVEPAHFDKIKALQLTKTAPEIFEYLTKLENTQQVLAKLDPVSIGNLEGGLRSSSGSALALIQAQSIQSNGGAQKAYYTHLSKANTGLLKMLQRYATTEKVIRVVGKVNSQYIKEFKYDAESLQNVSSVIYEPVDPMAQTVGGKQVLAENLMSKGLIKNIEQYITVTQTGNLQPLIEDDQALQLAQRAENEELREYKPQQAVLTENHEQHIFAHSAVIASPRDKQDQQLVSLTTQHIQEHVDMWMQLSMTNPALLIATGQKVLPPPPGMLPPGNIPPDANAGGPPQNEPSAPLSGPEKPVEKKAQQVKGPEMPMNPLTGQRAQQPGAM